jgi:predicted transcriptional regulator
MNGTVRSVMTKRVIALKRDADYKEIVPVLRKYRVSACPVINDGKATGGLAHIRHADGVVATRDRLTIADASHWASQPAGSEAGADDLVAKVR